MLREDIEQYTKLTGEDGWHVPIIKVGAYLDGYNKGLAVLDEIRTEIKSMFPPSGIWMYDEGFGHEHAVCEVLVDVLQIINKYMNESEDAE